ncbi:hypothetical protein AB1Y20_011014 [Prymnesium parvum]|uniref:Fe2OG dioxygenase domain-containing protein n=1 Tax=Prymnesium parvum TaxID=97485 RepID=A0AB34IP87_PRYPA
MLLLALPSAFPSLPSHPPYPPSPSSSPASWGERQRRYYRASARADRTTSLSRHKARGTLRASAAAELRHLLAVDPYDAAAFTPEHADFKRAHNTLFATLAASCGGAVFYLDGPDGGTTASLLSSPSPFARSRLYTANRHAATAAALRAAPHRLAAGHVAAAAAEEALADERWRGVPFGALYLDACGGDTAPLVAMVDAVFSEERRRVNPPRVAIGFTLTKGEKSGRSLADREVDVLRALRLASRSQGYSMSHVADDPSAYGVDPSVPKREGSTSTTWLLCERTPLPPTLPPAALATLLARRLVVVDAFLPPPLVRSLAADLRAERARGAAASPHPQHGAVEWYELLPPPAWEAGAAAESAARRQLYDLVAALRQSLEAAAALRPGLPLSARLCELRYAFYPPGGRYVRHRDARVCAEGGARRCFSFVLYLNEAWSERDGGQLRAFDADGGFVDVPPRGGTLVLFHSEEVWHEVLATSSSRMCIVGWFSHFVPPGEDAAEEGEEGEVSELGAAIRAHFRAKGQEVRLGGE